MPGTYISPAETGLYYLQSRYYDPETCRFINADEANVVTVSPDSANYDKNLYAYCDNNPVVRADSSGYVWNTIIGTISGAVVGGLTAWSLGEDIKAGVVSGALSGMFSGAVLDVVIAASLSGPVGLAVVAVGCGLVNAGGSALNQHMNGDEIDMATVAIDGVWGAVAGGLSFGLADVGGPACRTVKQIFSQETKK